MRYLIVPFIIYILAKTEGVLSQDEISKERSPEFWRKNAQDDLLIKLSKTLNLNKAKNIILFLGDGMSNPTITAARIFKGQNEGFNGERDSLSFEKFPTVGLSKTYCVDSQVADSACSATAYLTGVKSNYQTIGVSAEVKLNDCLASKVEKNQVDSIAVWAQNNGLSTGIVTTTTVTNASPAGTYSHTPNRGFESDVYIRALNQSLEDCEDIAKQLIFRDPGKSFNVILGGGRKNFLPNSTTNGNRLDNLDLIKHWEDSKLNWKRSKIMSKKARTKYVTDRESLLNVDFRRTDYLLGLFNRGHLDYHLDSKSRQPTLKEMTEAAIKVLQKNNKGYFLFVEGGLIDKAHHVNMAYKALDETLEFSKAVQKAVDLTQENDTLIVVTADHAHVMSMAGYSDRGNPITGIAGQVSNIDKLPYMTLSYANGPSAGQHSNRGLRDDLRNVDNIGEKDFQYPSLVPLQYESHGGDDVTVFARGPWAHLFSGVIEQNNIPHFMAFAGCLGNGLTMCSNDYK
ncbi:hypothetical protein ACFFRR_009978 [Megaselia abdita]